MSAGTTHSGEMSQDSWMTDEHPKRVTPRTDRAIDPTARATKRGFDMLSASSVGLEMGISVLIGILGGYWLDQHFGTTPWLMLGFLALGLVAGFRGVMRALRKADRDAAAETKEAPRG
jgi:ATP synthase protein I